MKHLILFDDSCPFCQRCIRFILAKDIRNQFCFAPLCGKTAQEYVDVNKRADSESIIFIDSHKSDNPQIYYRSKAAFKIFWCLGGLYRLIGWKYFLPGFLFDWCYMLIAKNRKRLCSKEIPYQRGASKGKFLP